MLLLHQEPVDQSAMTIAQTIQETALHRRDTGWDGLAFSRETSGNNLLTVLIRLVQGDIDAVVEGLMNHHQASASTGLSNPHRLANNACSLITTSLLPVLTSQL